MKALKKLRAAIGTTKQVAQASKAWKIWKRHERHRFSGLHMGYETAAILGAMFGIAFWMAYASHNPIMRLGDDLTSLGCGSYMDGSPIVRDVKP